MIYARMWYHSADQLWNYLSNSEGATSHALNRKDEIYFEMTEDKRGSR